MLGQMSPERYGWDTPAPTQLAQGAALCRRTSKIPSGVWERAASSCSRKVPRNSMPKRAAGLIPRQSDHCRSYVPRFGQPPFPPRSHSAEQKKVPSGLQHCLPTLPTWHQAKPVNKRPLKREHALTPWWISRNKPQQGASSTPPRQSPGRQRWRPTALTHQGKRGGALSCLDPSHPQDIAPALHHQQPTSASDLPDTGCSRAGSAR